LILNYGYWWSNHLEPTRNN